MDWIRKVPIGQYVAGKSGWMRRIDPRMKMAWVLLFLISPVLSSPEWRLGLVIALLLITCFSYLPMRIWWRPLCLLLLLSSLVGVLAIILPTGEPAALLTIRDSQELPNAIAEGQSWEIIRIGPVPFLKTSLGPLIVDRRSAELGLKTSTLIFTVVHSVNLMLITSSPEDLVWALRWFISPLRLLGLPIDRLSFQLLLSLRFIPLVQEEFQNLLRALSVRAVNFKKLGFKASLGLILSVGERLFANILLRSEQGAEALVSRGGWLIPPEYFKPSRSISRFSAINVFAGFLLLFVLVLRSQFGA
tara:strand:- start:207 stop:1115 length:909 start_codon:yes stop_codon:yes gene_type:complete